MHRLTAPDRWFWFLIIVMLVAAAAASLLAAGEARGEHSTFTVDDPNDFIDQDPGGRRLSRGLHGRLHPARRGDGSQRP